MRQVLYLPLGLRKGLSTGITDMNFLFRERKIEKMHNDADCYV